MSYGQMAIHVGRAKSVVMREAKRLGKYTTYDPDKAQQDFEIKTHPDRCKKNESLYGSANLKTGKKRNKKNVRSNRAHMQALGKPTEIQCDIQQG
jgi:IS30 family transposase